MPLSTEEIDAIEDWTIPANQQTTTADTQSDGHQSEKSFFPFSVLPPSEWQCTRCKSQIDLDKEHFCDVEGSDSLPTAWTCPYCLYDSNSLEEEHCGKCREINYVIHDQKKITRSQDGFEKALRKCLGDVSDLESLLVDIEKTADDEVANDEDNFLPVFDITTHFLRAIVDNQDPSEGNYIPNSLRDMLETIEWKCEKCGRLSNPKLLNCVNCGGRKPEFKFLFNHTDSTKPRE